jgi:hypothetical protein
LTTGITHDGPKAIKKKSYFKIRKIGWEGKKAGLKGKNYAQRYARPGQRQIFSHFFNKNDVYPAFKAAGIL